MSARQALSEQRRHYEAVLSLCDLEAEAIGSADAGRILSILQSKQEHMREISRLNERLKDMEGLLEQDPSLREDVTKLWNLINQILEIEKANEQGLRSLMERVRRKMKEAQDERQLLGRYGVGQAQPRYLDRRR